MKNAAEYLHGFVKIGFIY